MVTSAATTTSCTIIRIRLGIVFRISDTMKLLKAVMTVTESPITIAGSSCDVTASAEQMPRICTVMGLSFPNGVLNTSRRYLVRADLVGITRS